MSPTISGVIFDLDGTLLDSLSEIATPMNAALKAAGYSSHPIERFKRFVGDGARMAVYRALPESVREDTALVDRVLDDFLARYRTVSGTLATPYDGIPAMLDALTKRKLRLFVLSNKPQVFTEICVERQLALWNFEIVFGARENVPKKPDPAGAIEIVDRSGIPAKNLLYLGDTATDMKTATGAGMIAVGALWGFRSREELEEAGAAHMIDHPTALLELLH